MCSDKTVIVSKGRGMPDEKQKPKEWTELLCSRSKGGCGTVFWASKDSGEYAHSLDDGYGSESRGWLTACPVCKISAGGHDVKFVTLSKPPES